MNTGHWLPHPLQWSFQQRFLSGFIGCAGVLLYAIYTQYFGGLQPCPLCTLQRGAFVLLAAVFILGAMHNPRSRGVRIGYALAAIATALLGAAIAARHVWIQLLPPDRVPACGPDLGDMLRSWPLSRTLRQLITGSGECAVIDWTFWGLSMPAWSLITFAVLASWSGLSLCRRNRPD
jgi:disulfide bond formation protein DsbB